MIETVAVLAPEPIRARMAGMGIRALELARALSAEFSVRLIVPNDASEAQELAEGIAVVRAENGTLGEAAAGVHAGVVSGHAASGWFQQLPDVPVAADLYDPFPIENLHYARHLGPETARHDHETLGLALGRADFFLCASPEQRLFYSGALYAWGRIGAANFPEDSALSGLITVVPFGVPAAAARGDRAAGRTAAGVSGDGHVVLFGGIYDWYDPEPLLSAWPEILRRQPDARLLFFENPNPDTTPQRVFARAREQARRIDPGGHSILFSGWLPYASRADLYAAADLMVSISAEGLETELAYRTRLLDAAWGGLPSVTVGGGTLARELVAAGAAFESPRSPAALADRVAALLADAARRSRAGDAARRFASERSWSAVARPLLSWCRDARIDPNRLPASPAAKGSLLRRLFQ